MVTVADESNVMVLSSDDVFQTFASASWSKTIQPRGTLPNPWLIVAVDGVIVALKTFPTRKGLFINCFANSSVN